MPALRQRSIEPTQRSDRASIPVPLSRLAAAGDRFVATVGADCALDRTTLRIRTAQATYVIRAQLGPGDRPDFTPDISDLRATGPVVAWVETRLPVSGPGPTITLVVAHGVTGEILLRTQLNDFAYATGLSPDGTVVLPSLADCSIGAIAPAAPTLRRIGLPAGLCPLPSGAAIVAGGRVLYLTFGGYACTDGRALRTSCATRRGADRRSPSTDARPTSRGSTATRIAWSASTPAPPARHRRCRCRRCDPARCGAPARLA